MTAFTVADDRCLIEMIQRASSRLVVLAPGLQLPVATALGVAWRRLGGECRVILDVDPEVCRLGYGDVEALRHLQVVARGLGTMINHHPGVRIGLVIADAEMLVYTPTPLLIEAVAPAETPSAPSPLLAPEEPPPPPKPNAIRIEASPLRIEAELGVGPNGERDRTVGLDSVTTPQVEAVAKDVADNPPQRFDIARTVRVFNAQFEFVEIELKGASLARKTVRLPNYLLGLEERSVLDEAVHANLRLVDADSPVSGDRLQGARARIIRRYLTHLPGYGFIVLRSKKAGLERAIRRLGQMTACFQKRLTKQLQGAMDAKRHTLTKTLAPHLRRLPERLSELPFRSAEQVVDEELRELFGSAGDLIKAIQLRVVFKAVTYESLTDPEFIKSVAGRLPDVGPLFHEFVAAMALEPTAPLKGAA